MDASEVALWVILCPLTGMEPPCVYLFYLVISPKVQKTAKPIITPLLLVQGYLANASAFLLKVGIWSSYDSWRTWYSKTLSLSLPHVHLQSQSSLPPPKNCFIGLYILGSKKKWLNTVIFSILMWALREQKICTGYKRDESASEPRRPGRRKASLSNFCPPYCHI